MRITLSQAITGYLLNAQSRRLSEYTILDYKNTFRKLQEFLDYDPFFAEIDHLTIQEFLSIQQVSKKTLLNYHTGLSALWAWALGENLAAENIMRRVKPPRPEQVAIIPFSEEDIRAMLATLGKSKSYTRPGKRQSEHTLPNVERNRAILLLFLDTGLRVSELCSIKIHDLDIRNHRIQVMGKVAKERSVPFSPRSGQALWRYLATRNKPRADEPLFITSTGRALDRTQVIHMLYTLAGRAGITHCHPHRFRHTFAIEYLRNGGDPFTLQAILGHSTLDMVKRYVRLAQQDIQTAHRRASPVDNWRL